MLHHLEDYPFVSLLDIIVILVSEHFLILDEFLFEVQSLLFQVYPGAVELLNLPSDLPKAEAEIFSIIAFPTVLNM